MTLERDYRTTGTWNVREQVGTALALALIGAFSGGCTLTPRAQTMASELSQKVAVYRAEQSDRVERVNQEYRDSFNELMNAFVLLIRAQLQQGRDKDAQLITDSLISDDKATLIGSLRKSFLDTMKNQRQAIIDSDATVTAVRGNYLKSYSEAKLQLSKVDKVQANLKILATAETLNDEFANANKIIQNAVQTARDAQKNANAAAGKKSGGKIQKPSGSSGTPAPSPTS